MKLEIIIAIFSVGLFSYMTVTQKPSLYLIGDSTVNNPNPPKCGWGQVISKFFDTAKISVSNQAKAGRSTRTFIKEGRWEKVLNAIKPGDYLMMQFGHNESAKPDTSKVGNRGVLKGIGDDTVNLTWKDGTAETVHTYGFYLRKFVREAKAKGATVIICSMIPRNEFRNGKVLRADNDYGKWAKEVAAQENAFFIDLNKITADKYDVLGADKVKKLFPKDHTHTNIDGATINAQSIVEGLKQINACSLNNYLKSK